MPERISLTLELATMQELIDELTERPTFLGLVIACTADYKAGCEWQDTRTFIIHSNSNMGPTQAVRLLREYANEIEEKNAVDFDD